MSVLNSPFELSTRTLVSTPTNTDIHDLPIYSEERVSSSEQFYVNDEKSDSKLDMAFEIDQAISDNSDRKLKKRIEPIFKDKQKSWR